MRIPKQAKSVERKATKFAEVPVRAGVRPAGWLEILKKIGTGAISTLLV